MGLSDFAKKVSVCLVLVFVAEGGAFASGLGGYIGSCYTGRGFRTDIACAAAEGGQSRQVDSRTYVVSAEAKFKYSEPAGPDGIVEATFWVNDLDNFFDPESELPVLVRGIKCGFHRKCRYSVESHPVIFRRQPNVRILIGTSSFSIHNEFSAEYAETLEKIEVLLPGVDGVFVLDLKLR